MTDRLMSVSQVAAATGLSRQRFHQLMKDGVFPPPVYDIQTRRPHYTDEMLKVCVSVREKNIGINGRVVLFYARRPGLPVTKKQIRPHGSGLSTRPPKPNGLIDGLKGLGLATVTEQQVDAAYRELYPKGTTGVGEADVLRTVFVHLMRRH
jgi:hypothetical protein